VHPHLGPELEKIMLLYIPETAQRLVSLFERELPSVIAKIPAEVIPIVEKQIHFSGKIEE
jgi:hypothetical protein